MATQIKHLEITVDDANKDFVDSFGDTPKPKCTCEHLANLLKAYLKEKNNGPFRAYSFQIKSFCYTCETCGSAMNTLIE